MLVYKKNKYIATCCMQQRQIETLHNAFIVHSHTYVVLNYKFKQLGDCLQAIGGSECETV